jgi:hypothetical protein
VGYGELVRGEPGEINPIFKAQESNVIWRTLWLLAEPHPGPGPADSAVSSPTPAR